MHELIYLHKVGLYLKAVCNSFNNVSGLPLQCGRDKLKCRLVKLQIITAY